MMPLVNTVNEKVERGPTQVKMIQARFANEWNVQKGTMFGVYPVPESASKLRKDRHRCQQREIQTHVISNVVVLRVQMYFFAEENLRHGAFCLFLLAEFEVTSSAKEIQPA